MTEVINKIIYNCETGIEEVIPLTAEEIAEMEALHAQNLAQQVAFNAAQVAKEAARQSALTKLAALGLTAEEAEAIVK